MSDTLSAQALLPRTPAVSLDASQRSEFADFLRELVSVASPHALAHFRRTIPVANKGVLSGDYDPVTQADRDAETSIRELIRTRYPGHGIFGEEHGFEGGESGLTWVIDPIDGTRAFITGQLHWGVLVALYDGEKPVLGAMLQPFTKELFIADGEHSWLEHEGQRTPLTVRACAELGDAILCSTTPEMFALPGELAAFEALAFCVRMRRFGGDCYSYCMLAHGLVDLIVEADLKPYDIQALIPIVEGAGGIVTDWQGDSAAHGGRVIAAIVEGAGGIVTDWQGDSAAHGGRVIAAGDPRVHAVALAMLRDTCS
jgi:myo-inositol-1(or 4)-monophosphatase